MGIADYSRLINISRFDFLAIIIFYSCLGALSLSSCAPIPKIIVLHDPLTVDEHISLGLGYEIEGEYDYAIQEYRKAMNRSGNDYRSLFYTGNAYYKKEDYESAKKYYSKALKIVPDNGDIHNNLACVYKDTGNLEGAKGEIDRALKIKIDPYYLDTLARIYDKMGRYEEAIGVLKEALAITPPSDNELLYTEYKLLGDLHERLGEYGLAREVREKAEEFKRDSR